MVHISPRNTNSNFAPKNMKPKCETLNPLSGTETQTFRRKTDGFLKIRWMKKYGWFTNFWRASSVRRLPAENLGNLGWNTKIHPNPQRFCWWFRSTSGGKRTSWGWVEYLRWVLDIPGCFLGGFLNHQQLWKGNIIFTNPTSSDFPGLDIWKPSSVVSISDYAAPLWAGTSMTNGEMDGMLWGVRQDDLDKIWLNYLAWWKSMPELARKNGSNCWEKWQCWKLWGYGSNWLTDKWLKYSTWPKSLIPNMYPKLKSDWNTQKQAPFWKKSWSPWFL